MKTVAKFGVIACLGALSACSTMTEKELEPKTVTIDSEKKQFTFKSETPSGDAVSEQKIVATLSDALVEASGFRDADNIYKKSNGYRHLRGAQALEGEPGEIPFRYVNGHMFEDDDYEFVSEVSSTYSYEIQDNGEQKTVTVTTPDSLRSSIGRAFKYKLPLTLDQASENIQKINASMTPAIELTHDVEGSVDVEWDMDAVNANFDRIFSEISSEREEGKVYRLKADAYTWPVTIEVFPYREGSKVIYEFEVPYELRGDGTSTYPEADVALAVQKIEDAAND